MWALIQGETEDLCLAYPNLSIFGVQLNKWSARMIPIWNKLIDTTEFEYNPIENYDRHEQWHDDGNRNGWQHAQGEDHRENKVNAFDTASYRDHDKTDGTNKAQSSNNENSTGDHTGWLHGNIGVTTTQQMIAEERESVQYDPYVQILNDYKKVFTLGIAAL